MLTPADLGRLAGALRAAFCIDGDVEFSVEIDPSDMDEARLDAMAGIGVTRASLGVQDFDPKVQKAINREQGYDLTSGVVTGLRQRGIAAVNLDLVYGLPHQTVDGVAETVKKCLSMRPDRIALFGYAHVPWFKKHQTMIDEAALPGAEERLAQAARAAELIRAAGYEAIGIDHFALPGDALARAARNGELRRNFQGYTDDACETLIGLGPSSVSRYPEGYAQNAPAMGVYARAVGAGSLPVARGIALSAEDRARGWVIERLMCDFAFSVDELMALGAEIGPAVVRQAEAIAASQPGRLVRAGDRFVIPPAARARARSVAAGFDAYFGKGTARHSAAV